MSVQNHKTPVNTFLKRGVFYYQRRVPIDLLKHYKTKKITLTLRTKDARHAGKAARKITCNLDNYWLDLRLKSYESLPLANTLYEVPNRLKMSDAQAQYLEVKGNGRTDKFVATTNRYMSYFLDVVHDKYLDDYTSADAIKFRESLAKRALSPVTIKKAFATIKAVHNFVTKENGLDLSNPFSGVHIETAQYTSKKRLPINNEDINLIQDRCLEINDDLRLLIALISNTGMRLAEAVGLMVDDIVLDDDIPHLIVRPHKHRRLKTVSSERLIPLVGSSLEAAHSIVGNVAGQFCFPRYTNQIKCNAGSASASINKWLKTVTGKNYVCHGFRHAFRDRLRAVDISTELIDEIGGWSRKSIGAQYGAGYTLYKKHEALTRMRTYD